MFQELQKQMFWTRTQNLPHFLELKGRGLKIILYEQEASNDCFVSTLVPTSQQLYSNT